MSLFALSYLNISQSVNQMRWDSYQKDFLLSTQRNFPIVAGYGRTCIHGNRKEKLPRKPDLEIFRSLVGVLSE